MHLLARAGAILLGALLLLTLPAPQATAHIRTTTGHGVLASTDSGADLALSLEYDPLARAVGMGTEAIDAPDDAARADALRTHDDALAAYLDEHTTLSVDGVGCEPSLESPGMEERRGVPYARLAVAYACPGPASGAYAFDYRVFGATDGVVDDHTVLLDYELGGVSGETFLNRAYSEVVTGEPEFTRTSVRLTTFGVDNLLRGLDHVLFVVALLLGARTVGDALRLASVFALAYSTTLGLAALGWVDLPGSVLGPLIALSIVYVAVDNVVGEPSRYRLATVFGFGLLHGIAFAEVLRIGDDVGWTWLGSLLSFDLGLVIGLAALVLVAFPALVLVRRFRWSVPAFASATSFVALIGLVWFFERVTVT
jgi:hypothetical protein